MIRKSSLQDSLNTLNRFFIFEIPYFKWSELLTQKSQIETLNVGYREFLGTLMNFPNCTTNCKSKKKQVFKR
jgi:hypothetical protein